MSIRKIRAIFHKQMKDTFKNKTVLVQFIMFPIITLIMQNAIQVDGMPNNYFVTLFATMYMGMAPITSMAAILAEEKEKNTLRVLMMSNVKPIEYLLGVGSYIWFICMLGVLVFASVGRYQGDALLYFLAVMTVGVITSMLIGAVIGTFSKTQMMATSITIPVMIIFSFMPMLSMYNEIVRKIARFTYSQQISLLMNQTGSWQIGKESILVMAANIMIAIGLFTYAYRKSGLA